MALRPTMATLNPKSPRVKDWLRVYGKTKIQLRGPLPVRATSPAGVQFFHHVHESELTPEVRERLADHVSEKFCLSRDEVLRSIDDPAHGVPILADDVTVECDSRLFL